MGFYIYKKELEIKELELCVFSFSCNIVTAQTKIYKYEHTQLFKTQMGWTNFD
jgi:hypothetical protein